MMNFKIAEKVHLVPVVLCLDETKLCKAKSILQNKQKS